MKKELKKHEKKYIHIPKIYGSIFIIPFVYIWMSVYLIFEIVFRTLVYCLMIFVLPLLALTEDDDYIKLIKSFLNDLSIYKVMKE